jgi:hypothetical protein
VGKLGISVMNLKSDFRILGRIRWSFLLLEKRFINRNDRILDIEAEGE